MVAGQGTVLPLEAALAFGGLLLGVFALLVIRLDSERSGSGAIASRWAVAHECRGGGSMRKDDRGRSSPQYRGTSSNIKDIPSQYISTKRRQ